VADAGTVAEVTAAALKASAKSFREANKELHLLFDGKRGGVSYETRAQLSQLGADSIGLATLIADVHEAVADEWRQREARQGGSPLALLPFGGSLADPPLGQFIVLAKAFFIFLRAYQDAMYGVLFEITTGRRPGRGNSRMQQAVKTSNNPVAKVLAKELDGYLEWFGSWRDLRNEVKEGVNFTLLGPPEDIGLTFTSSTDSGRIVMFGVDRPVVRMSHFASALDVSRALAQTAQALLQERVSSA
jgi:hypothetical protein